MLHAHFSLYETAPVTIQIWPLRPNGQLNLKGTVQRDLREIINSTNQQQNFFLAETVTQLHCPICFGQKRKITKMKEKKI